MPQRYIPFTLCLSSLAVLAQPAGGQTVFPSSQQIDESFRFLVDLAVLDLDGDGNEDIVAIDRFAEPMSIFPGDGQGGFERPVYLAPVEGTPIRLVKGDFDGDGRQDFVVVSTVLNGARAVLFRNLGDFEFARLDVGAWDGTSDQPGFSPFQAADFNSDGYLDFIYAVTGTFNSDKGVFVLTFDGTAFAASREVLTTDAVNSFQVVEVDRDGLPDVIMQGRTDDRWRLATRLDAGGFSVPRSVFPANVADLPGLQLHDVDLDGLLDLVTVPAPDQRRIQIQRGQGGVLDFGTMVNIPTSSSAFAHPRMVRDYDGDGVMDLTHTDRRSDRNFRSILRGLGGLSFDTGQVMTQSIFPVSYEDVNGDSSLEALGGEIFSRRIEYVSRVGTQGPAWYDTPGEIQRFTGGALGSIFLDADRDGDKDVVVYGTDVGTSWYENEGAGSFARAATFEGVANFRRVEGGYDLNGDGFDDMLVRVEGTFGLAARLSRGPLEFDPPVVISSVGNPDEIELVPGDFDGDGDLDLIQVGAGSSTDLVVFALFNDGSGIRFPRQTIAQGGPITFSVEVFDINEDGFDDIVRLGRNEAFVHINRGTGSFEDPVSYPVPTTVPVLSRPPHSATIDVDGDGSLDLVVRDDGGPWQWTPNGPGPGIGAFMPLGIPDVEDATDLAQLDLNGDGIQDLVVFLSRRFFQNIFAGPDRILLGDGFGGYLPGQVIGDSLNNTYRPRFLDLDGDGDLDAFSTGADEDLVVHLNESTPMTGTAPQQCSTGAINSSGRGGLLAAYGSADVSSTNLSLVAYRLPRNQFGIFAGSLTLTSPTAVVGSLGTLCLGGAIGRYDSPSELQSSGAAGLFSIPLNPAALETPAGPVPATAGETWYFQAWHRDLSPTGAPTSNFTAALGLTFLP